MCIPHNIVQKLDLRMNNVSDSNVGLLLQDLLDLKRHQLSRELHRADLPRSRTLWKVWKLMMRRWDEIEDEYYSFHQFDSMRNFLLSFFSNYYEEWRRVFCFRRQKQASGSSIFMYYIEDDFVTNVNFSKLNRTRYFNYRPT